MREPEKNIQVTKYSFAEFNTRSRKHLFFIVFLKNHENIFGKGDNFAQICTILPTNTNAENTVFREFLGHSSFPTPPFVLYSLWERSMVFLIFP